LLEVFDRQKTRGLRDFAMVAVLLGCGLRRAELSADNIEDLQQREEHWVFADLIGATRLGRQIRAQDNSAFVINGLRGSVSGFPYSGTCHMP
jgi:site-specific recombinase XerC